MRRHLWVATAAATLFTLLGISQVAQPLFGPLDHVINDSVARMSDGNHQAWDIIADLLVYGVATGLCLFAVYDASRHQDLAHGAAIALLLLAMAANDTILKPFFDRARPPTAWLETPAFPSGHTSAALLVSASILLGGITRTRLILVAAVTVATATARVLSGAHWVSDVLGSIAYGTLIAALVLGSRRVAAPVAA